MTEINLSTIAADLVESYFKMSDKEKRFVANTLLRNKDGNFSIYDNMKILLIYKITEGTTISPENPKVKAVLDHIAKNEKLFNRLLINYTSAKKQSL